MSFRWLVPVKGATEHVHLVPKETGVEGYSLCGQRGPLDRYARARFRRVYRGGKLCNACHVVSCREPSRIAWAR
jgi:hypothetical protein